MLHFTFESANESREALAILGITLFTFRFTVNLILIAKHVLHAAITKELSAKKVLRQELEKRGFTMASDLVWAVVGLLTTYNNLFHIHSLAVPPIILTFLTFDTLLFIAQWFFEATKYTARLQELTLQKSEANALEQLIIDRQIDVLNDEWDVLCAYYTINILGANILALSFAIAMLYTGPLALAGMALFSMIGNALYNTAEEYKKYQKSKISVKRERANGAILDDEHHQELLIQLTEECEQDQREFWKHLGVNVGGVAFIITAAVISWPIALCLTAAYIGYRLNKTYQKQFDTIEHKEVPHDIYRFFDSVPDDNSALEYTSEYATTYSY